MKQEIIDTLKDLLKFKTYEKNDDEFTKIFDYIKHKYDNLEIKEYTFGSKKTMVLSNTRDINLDLIFCTHVDVVYAETYDFQEDDENIYGRGTIDMKASLAVCLTVLNNVKTSKKIALFITSDEELTGNCANELSKIYNSKLTVVPDGGTNFELITEEKGLLQLELSIKTKTAHAAQLFNGVNAITELVDVYQKLIKKYPLPKSSKEYFTSINLSKLVGGESNNQVPGFAKMILDIRNISKDKHDDIINFIHNINKDVDVKVLLDQPAFISDLENQYVQKYIASATKVLGKPVEKIGCESTSDAIFFSEKGFPTVIMNPIGYYAHSPKEYVNKDSLLTLYEIYKNYIEEE